MADMALTNLNEFDRKEYLLGAVNGMKYLNSVPIDLGRTILKLMTLYGEDAADAYMLIGQLLSVYVLGQTYGEVPPTMIDADGTLNVDSRISFDAESFLEKALEARASDMRRMLGSKKAESDSSYGRPKRELDRPSSSLKYLKASSLKDLKASISSEEEVPREEEMDWNASQCNSNPMEGNKEGSPKRTAHDAARGGGASCASPSRDSDDPWDASKDPLLTEIPVPSFTELPQPVGQYHSCNVYDLDGVGNIIFSAGRYYKCARTP